MASVKSLESWGLRNVDSQLPEKANGFKAMVPGPGSLNDMELDS